MVDYKISILIPSWNGASYIKQAIDSILNNNYKNFEIISIAGGTDETFQISKEYEQNYSEHIIALGREECSKNEALNLGLTYTTGDIIVITDVDCVYPKDWLRKINEIFQDKTINVITGFHLPYRDSENSLAEYNRIKSGYNIVRFENGEEIIGNKLWGGNSAFRKKIFIEKIGKFKEISQSGEDKLLGMELNEKGECVYYFNTIYVYTEHYSENIKKFFNQRTRWAKDLFIDFSIRDIFKWIILLGIGIFKLFYPPLILIIWFIFFNDSIFWFFLFLSPWFISYIFFMIFSLLELKKKSKMVNLRLNKNYDYKKAFIIVPLMFFIYGIINLKAYINPLNHKWDH